MNRETQLIHADDAGAIPGQVAPPIYQSSTFSFPDVEAMVRAASTPTTEQYYTRYGNPNHGSVQRILATLEGGEAAMVAASGMGAISATVMALTKAGDHIVAQRMIYDGARVLVRDTLSRFGVECTFVDQSDPAAFEAAMRPNTILVMLESPSNPLNGITDITAVSKIARAHGALVTIDNTFATPINQQPLKLGVDVVIHSATKYLGGHSDLLAGVVVASKELIARIWDTHHIVGATLGPFEAWLLLRGLRTLDVRMQRHNANAMKIAQFLKGHNRVREVYYPGLPTHPGHEIAKKQMSGFGGLVSFEIDGTFEDTKKLIDKLKLVHFAVSLGGVESLIVQTAALWPGNKVDSPDARAMGIAPSILRFSVGLENADDLIADFDAAL